MKTLEFRLFDKESNIYVQDYFEFYIGCDGDIYKLEETGGFYLTEELNHVSHLVILEQFTGAKDKNGVNIFEGDFLLNDRDGIYIIEWDGVELCWQGTNPKTGDIEYLYALAEWSKVIGNINQNEELLQ